MRIPPRLTRLARLLPLSALLIFGACADAPVSLKYETKNAIESARRGSAGVYAREILDKAEESYRLGVRAMDEQAARWGASRDYDLALVHFQTALRRARLSSEVAHAREDDLRQRTRSLFRTADRSIANLDFFFTYLTPRTHARSELMHARVLYEEAQALERRGDLAPALDRAESATQEMANLSDRLAGILDRYTTSDRVDTYRRWVQDTIAQSAAYGSRAILVDKLRHTLTLLQGGRPLRTYRADMGLGGAQDKAVAGDKATPEGRYKIIEKRANGQTRWYKALLLNYPNDEDQAQFAAAKRRGQISSRARIGNLIEIHGQGGRYQDWTDGCVALQNGDIDELFGLVSVGTPVTIVGYESDDWLVSRGRSRSVVAENTPPRAQRSRSRR
jgi:hypothetical protein